MRYSQYTLEEREASLEASMANPIWEKVSVEESQSLIGQLFSFGISEGQKLSIIERTFAILDMKKKSDDERKTSADC